MSMEKSCENPQEPLTFCLLNPALMPEWFWLPTAHYLQEKGHDYVIPNVPRDDTAVTLEQNIDIIEQSMGDNDRQYIVALSRGVEYAVRYLDRMARKDTLHKIAGWMVISSVGPRGYEVASDFSTIPMQRHTSDYTKGISIDKRGLEIIDPKVAISSLLHDIEDERLLSQVLVDLTPNRPLSADEIESVPILKRNILPLAWYVGLYDAVDNTELSVQVARQRFGVEPKKMEWGHISPLTHPAEVSEAILSESQQAFESRTRKV